MKYLHLISNLILVFGAIVALTAIALDLAPLMTLIGLMMIVAGIVKIITVRIWAGFFDGEESTGA